MNSILISPHDSILISPHDDDFALFAAFTCLRERPVIMIVFDSYLQANRGLQITHEQRAAETLAASRELGGLPVVRLGFRDSDPTVTPDLIHSRMMKVCRALGCGYIFGPAWEPGGHEQHNLVAEAFIEPMNNVGRYLTYTRTPCQKSTSPHEVPILEPAWIGKKLRALACFESQFLPGTGCAPHFLRDQREYLL